MGMENEGVGEKEGMFHYSKCLFFGRVAGGGVRILKLEEDPYWFTLAGWPEVGRPYPDAKFDMVVDPLSWPVVMAKVSYKDEPLDVRIGVAEEFHNGPKAPEEVEEVADEPA